MTADKVMAKPLVDAIEAAGLNLNQAAHLAGYQNMGALLERGDQLITVWRADRISVLALNRHPCEIYGDYWLDKTALLQEEMRWRNEVAS